MSKLWVYIEETKKLAEVDAEKCKTSEHAPEGRIRYYPRKGTDKWQYTPYGKTREQCVENANIYVNREITELKEKLAALENELVKG